MATEQRAGGVRRPWLRCAPGLLRTMGCGLGGTAANPAYLLMQPCKQCSVLLFP